MCQSLKLSGHVSRELANNPGDFVDIAPCKYDPATDYGTDVICLADVGFIYHAHLVGQEVPFLESTNGFFPLLACYSIREINTKR